MFMFQKLIALARIPAGFVLIVLGLMALVTPLTPGSWLVVVGLELMGFRLTYGPTAKKLYRKVRQWWDGRQSRV